jgi:hypothetical protein
MHSNTMIGKVGRLPAGVVEKNLIGIHLRELFARICIL